MSSPLLTFLLVSFSFASLSNCELPGRTNSSNLCSRAPVQSCLHQVPFYSPDVVTDDYLCKVQAANNTRTPLLCGKQAWEKQETCSNPRLCGLHLQVYRHVAQPSLPLYRTAFNITLSNPAPEARIRYSDTPSSNFTFCVNFTVSESLQITSPLWYDCVFHNRNLEGQSLRLEYLINNKYGLLAFRVPQERDLDKGFVYVHLHYTQQLLVTFQALPEPDPLTNYKLVVCKWVEDNCHEEHVQPIDLRNETTFTLRFKNLITVSVNQQLPAGNFSVRIDDPDCTSTVCYNTESPFFVIPDEDVKHRLFFPIFALTAAIITCAILLYHRATCHPYAQPCDCKSKPTMLLVHDSASSDSVWMEAASIFLREFGGFDVWLDFVHIPQSEHKDPLRWYSDAIKKADIVAVVVGQAAISSLEPDQRSTIYHHTFDLALELIASCISQRLRDKEANVVHHFVVLEASQSAAAVPNSCASFARFRIPRQTAELVNYVYSERCECGKRTSVSCNLTASPSHNGHVAREAFNAIYNRLRHRGALRQTHVASDAKVGESATLLDASDETDAVADEYGNQRRERLDAEFGANVTSVSALETLTA